MVWSLQTPSRPLLNVEATTIPTDLKEVKSSSRKRKRHDLEEEESGPSSSPGNRLPPRTYFPASCEHEFGPLPIPPFSNRGKTTFPHNISFRTADWTTTPVPEDAEGYNVVIAYISSPPLSVFLFTKHHSNHHQIFTLQMDTSKFRRQRH